MTGALALERSEGPGAPPAERPTISVFVTAHDRRNYLRGAVENLLGQTLPRARFEILVVKNYADPEIDSFLEAQGIEHWVTSAGPLAEKLLEALTRSQGRVLTFLEDDDRYLPERLATIEAAFESDPSLGFYRNGFEVIDEAGQPYVGRLPDAVRASYESTRDLVVRDAEKDRDYPNLLGALPDFNTSTMALRRDLLESVVPYFHRIAVGVDRFLFHTAVLTPCTIRLDRRRWTLYRIHPGNTGLIALAGAARVERSDRIMANDRVDEAVLYDLLRNSPRHAARHELEARRVVLAIYDLLRRPLADRREMARLLRHLPEYRHSRPVQVNHLLALEGLVYLASPAAARRLHRRHLATSLGVG